MDDPDVLKRGLELREMMHEFLQSLTPYQRRCMLNVHMAEMRREAVDPEERRVIEEAKDNFDARWRERRQRRSV